jgi:D-beta-D-heptose 7-phosphate kinase/D-beta-D-heptose 1-phosphate adenosyltransferase
MKFNILLIGDDCQDVYQYGYVDRISPEAPVPVFKLDHKFTKPGMAGNVYQNLVNLGCTVFFLHGKTSTKTRLIDRRSGQHIVRIDADVISEPLAMPDCDLGIYSAIVISDYNKGTVDYELVQELRKAYSGPIFVDTKKIDLARFEGCYVKINSSEYSLARTFPSELIVTQGRNGVTYQDQIFPAENIEVVDTCGAGDTFLAALTLGYLKNKTISEAIKFANRAAAITVQHSGVYAPTMEEICGFQV